MNAATSAHVGGSRFRSGLFDGRAVVDDDLDSSRRIKHRVAVFVFLAGTCKLFSNSKISRFSSDAS